MNAAIPLTHILDKLTDLLPLTYDELEAMTAKQLRDNVAKILGIAKGYQLKKAELLDSCWLGLENVRAQLQVAETSSEQALTALKQLKKNDFYQIPISEVAEKTYQRLREIASKGNNLQEMKEAINGVVAAIAKSEQREFEFSTVKARRLDIKKIMQLMVATEIPLLKETMQVLLDYFYTQLLSFQREDSIQLSKSYKNQVKARNTEKTPVKIGSLVADCRQTLEQLSMGKSPHWTKVSIAAALGLGRRMVEIHSLGHFEVTAKYTMHFSGQAKTRDAEGAKTEFTIPTLFPASQLSAAIDYLETQDRRLPPEQQIDDQRAVNKAFGMPLSRAMAKYPNISYKGLRAIYAECQWGLLPESEKARTEKHIRYSAWLGYLDKDGAQDATFMSYMVYQVEDFEAIKGFLKS